MWRWLGLAFCLQASGIAAQPVCVFDGVAGRGGALPGQIELDLDGANPLTPLLVGDAEAAVEDWLPKPSVAQILRGNFTGASSRELLLLLRNTRPTEHVGTLGAQLDSRIVILRDWKVVVDHAVEGGWVACLMPGLGEGPQDVLLECHWTWMGESPTAVSLLSFLGGKVRTVRDFGVVDYRYEGPGRAPWWITSKIWYTPASGETRTRYFRKVKGRGFAPLSPHQVRRDSEALMPRGWPQVWRVMP